MLNFRQRQWIFVAIAIAVVIGFTLIAAPSGNRNNSGSTYGRDPDGYGAWYEYMSQREMPIKRWRKTFTDFVKKDTQETTYIQILTKIDFQLNLSGLSKPQSDWVSKGNTLVILGRNQAASAAPFKSFLSTGDSPLSSRQIEIETTRRYRGSNQEQSLLSDRYGAVIWSEKIGKGKVIYSTTPFLAAIRPTRRATCWKKKNRPRK